MTRRAIVLVLSIFLFLLRLSRLPHSSRALGHSLSDLGHFHSLPGIRARCVIRGQSPPRFRADRAKRH